MHKTKSSTKTGWVPSKRTIPASASFKPGTSKIPRRSDWGKSSKS